ncbi:hypothetical protein GO988_09815 [Hymenobacter sp. HMF4947]|uniref:Macroglobulin domain-containing protein n=1 Tax=Hymenobacter ginkgonis TaxID=2682976 RepID=A0A7K1TDZ2_9BACT|nr:hypothetical protein [Hymenobacter ginkgonis]MVN76619.1 hypothetical protein [Hymenobacter ginkgonis]
MRIFDAFFRRGWGLGLAVLVWTLPPRLAQAQAPDSLAATIGRQLAHYGQQVLVEKLYGHLDRPTYTARETMWLKLYAVDGTYHKPLALSKVAYVEILNQAQQPVVQTSIALRDATGQGSLNLPASLPSGRYVVRAYTSWMKNFGPEFYFQIPVTIINTFAASGPAPAPAALAPDVQFFPEGGALVQGLASKVAFRIADKAGHGLAATGTVRDTRGAVVATFRTLKFGLGSFSLPPVEAGAAYVADLRLANGTSLTAKLPAVAAQGYALQLEDASATQLRISVAARVAGATSLALVAHSGQHVATAQVVRLDAQGQAVFVVDKRELLDGVSHFTLFNSRREPVCERLYFQRPRHPLAISAAAAKGQYGPRERVALHLATPQAANLSLAVYQLDSLTAGAAPVDISSFLSLTSDLKGTVENPVYYLRDSSQVGRAATDNLMLTHGWSRFSWRDVLAPRPPALPYPPELNGPLVQGRVRTAAGAPAPGIVAYLATPSRTVRFYSSRSRPDGLVQFELKDLYGPHQLIVQTNWRRDSTYQLELLSPYSTRYAASTPSSFALAPALTAALTQRHIQTQVQRAYFGTHAQYALPPRDTLGFFGTPAEQYRLDDFTRFKVMEEVMREYVMGVRVRLHKDGFHFLVADKQHQVMFHEDPLVLLDGVPVFNVNKLMAFDPLRIRQVAVVTNRYYYGPEVYEGVVSYRTYKSDLAGFPLDPRALLADYEGVQGQREFFAPRYETAQQQQSTLADFRNLLHWQPEIKTSAGRAQELTFYTSDQVGRYLVVVQGLAANGQAGSTSFTLEVKPTL